MSTESHWPPTIGKQRIRYLATSFNSSNSTVAGVANEFDRRRLEARIEFERAYSRIWQNEATRECRNANDLEAAKMEAHHSVAVLEAFHRTELKRPARLRGNMSSFLDPFAGELTPFEIYCEGPALDKPRTMRATVPDGRKRYVALVHFSDDETPEGVPEEHRAAYDLAMRAETEEQEIILEKTARHYGSTTGAVDDIPTENRATASRYWRRFNAMFAAQTAFELDLTRIAFDEQRAREAEEAAERKAEEVIDGIERQIEDAAQDIFQDILAEQE